jgi:hypothetical protein
MKRLCVLLVGLLLVLGCDSTKRSISNSTYAEPGHYRGYVPCAPGLERDFVYHGELSEFDVLGIARGEITSENEIRRALDTAQRVNLHRGSTVMLIQSGATFPDGPMVAELSQAFRVVSFSGVPPVRPLGTGQRGSDVDPETYAKSLRLTAARAGAETIICYWGLLESESQHLPTKTVSWVPVVNWIIPDEKQHLRLRLKIALIDVRSGNWGVLSPAPVEGQTVSISPRRAVADQKQVEKLKQVAYENGARELVKVYAKAQ